MSAVARVGDLAQGTCRAPVHSQPVEFTATFSTGSDTVFVDGAPVVRIGDVGHTDCGHTIIAITGSSIVLADGIGVVRMNDLVEVQEGGEGVVITGSDITLAE